MMDESKLHIAYVGWVEDFMPETQQENLLGIICKLT
jgi:hypothetical protein